MHSSELPMNDLKTRTRTVTNPTFSVEPSALIDAMRAEAWQEGWAAREQFAVEDYDDSERTCDCVRAEQNPYPHAAVFVSSEAERPVMTEFIEEPRAGLITPPPFPADPRSEPEVDVVALAQEIRDVARALQDQYLTDNNASSPPQGENANPWDTEWTPDDVVLEPESEPTVDPAPTVPEPRVIELRYGSAFQN